VIVFLTVMTVTFPVSPCASGRGMEWAGDVNGDGNPDLAVAEPKGSRLFIMFLNADLSQARARHACLQAQHLQLASCPTVFHTHRITSTTPSHSPCPSPWHHLVVVSLLIRQASYVTLDATNNVPCYFPTGAAPMGTTGRYFGASVMPLGDVDGNGVFEVRE
jgi:hypothetical protein